MEKLNADFKNTCKIIFGQEIGGLLEFEPYLKEAMLPHKLAKSSVSGKQVMLGSGHYPDGARFASQDELSSVKFQPLNINDIKDIDLLFLPASERAIYCGNKLFGTNFNIEHGDNVADCVDVYHSHDIYNSKYAAFCSIGRVSRSIYSLHVFWNCSNVIRCSECTVLGAARSFECHCSTGISDSYFCLNCSGCQNCMFSFNQRGKSYLIGNLQLTKERYADLKSKLVSEMAEKLKKDKRLFTMADIASFSPATEQELAEAPPQQHSEQIEKAFASTAKIVLGKEHRAKALAIWLSSRALPRKKINGSGKQPVVRVESPIGRQLSKAKLYLFSEAASGAAQIKLSDAERPSLQDIAARAGKMARFSVEVKEGQNTNIVDTALAFDSTNIHDLWWSMKSKHSAHSTIVTESEHIFGGYGRIIFSEFCIGSHNMTYCKGCFECDSCFKCRDCYFCHNCENVEEGIFCFNAKGLRYAVFNTQLPKEEYLKIKKMLLDYVNSELDRKGGLDFGIFNIPPSTSSRPQAPRAGPPK